MIWSEFILNKKIKSNKMLNKYTITTFYFLIYATIVSYLLVKWVIPVYGNGNMTFEINEINIFISITNIAIISFFINLHKNKIKKLFIELFVLQVIIPMLILYSLTKEYSIYDLYITMYVFSVILISLISLISLKLSNKYFRSKNIKKIHFLLSLLVFFTITRYFILNGIKMFNLNFNKVYNYRFLLRETMTGYLLYLDNWTFNVINPMCISLSLYAKKKMLFVFFFILQIILYGFSSHKSVLFSGFMAVFFYIIAPYLLTQNNKIVNIAIFANSIAVFFYLLKIKGMFCALYYRVMVIPAQINYQYYEFFSKNGFDWFRHSFLRKFTKSNYDLPLPMEIGLEYYKNAEISANTGFMASGYAQGGFLVILLYSIIVALLITILSSLAKKISSRLILSLAILPISSLYTSADLPTFLLTGGGMLLLLLLYLLSLDKTMNNRYTINKNYVNIE